MKVPVAGGETTTLLPDDAKSELSPRLSGDGKRLGYHTFDYDNKTGSFVSSVRVVGFDAGNVDPKVPESELRIYPEYRWSPDNSSLTYLKRSGVPNLWSIKIDSKESKEKQITDFTSGLITNFCWANDGRKLFIVRATLNTDVVLIKNVSPA
jgi:Tol biopolymer transport system component